MNEKEQAMWGSHLPALLLAVGSSNGPVLELGVGHFSTPHLHAICGARRRSLVSVDDSPEWAAKFKGYNSPNHAVVCRNYAEFLNETKSETWSVAFIDHSPGGANRANAFADLIQHSSYVVVHDYHLENSDHIAPLLVGLKTARVFNKYNPPTLVASRDYELPECEAEL